MLFTTKSILPIDHGKVTKFMRAEQASEMRPALVKHAQTLLDLHFRAIGKVPARSYEQEVEACVRAVIEQGNDSAECIGLLDAAVLELLTR